jgi:hypothetical protein
LKSKNNVLCTGSIKNHKISTCHNFEVKKITSYIFAQQKNYKYSTGHNDDVKQFKLKKLEFKKIWNPKKSGIQNKIWNLKKSEDVESQKI